MESVLSHYIIGKVSELADVIPPEVVLIPIVAPESMSDELPDRYAKVSDYYHEALQVENFESFLLLLDKITAECGLSIIDDQTVIAAILNRYRVDADLPPL
jgi:hypothetical protein